MEVCQKCFCLQQYGVILKGRRTIYGDKKKTTIFDNQLFEDEPLMRPASRNRPDAQRAITVPAYICVE